MLEINIEEFLLENWLGFAYSFSFLFGILITAFILKQLDKFPSEVIRKFIHISVSNWWFILVNHFHGLYASLLGPTLFIVLNSLATFLDWARHLGLNDRSRNFGLIYFPISLVILIFMQHFGLIPDYVSGMSILVMGYGDGFAALFGKHFGVSKIHPLAGKKTYVGSFAMLITSILVISLMSEFYHLHWLSSIQGISMIVTVSALATVLEVITPLGLDNLSVPIGVALSLKFLMPFFSPK